MKLSEAIKNVADKQNARNQAQYEFELAIQELEGSECDHPDTEGLTCTYCGEFAPMSEEQLQDMDDCNVLMADSTEGHYPFAPMSSMYFSWPQERV